MASFYDVFISDAVLQELNEGNYPRQEKIFEFASKIELLPKLNDLEFILECYIENYVMPKTLIGDAIHLAYASYYKNDYLPIHVLSLKIINNHRLDDGGLRVMD